MIKALKHQFWKALYWTEVIVAGKLDPRMGDGPLWKLSDFLCDRMLEARFGTRCKKCDLFYVDHVVSGCGRHDA